ncbi:MAG: DNA polymerase III subunit gamma/tau [Ruminococcaceae bacterium]|jgi:DNA polymerase-3 subunit gamma/tau|nr:DNA polymerase III subunit gamma/tau [Oscillospiraceae bacterium]
MYQALYRKWRPRTFDEVVGQAHITDTLRRQVAEGRTAHAYLFTGTRGTGKTTCARILAKAINCLDPQDGAPCCRCEACRSIDEGRALDVTELDAASNNGVDQVRALREEAVYTPSVLQRRVYIIDEVHMLSTAAFNALLKILEEPPEHLLFILATTELHKVPATILSRCQRFAFKRILPRDMERQLLHIARAEGIALTDDGAEILARMANGALRDALSLLDQCRVAEGTLDSSAVLDVLGLAGSVQTMDLMRLVLDRDTAGVLALFDKLYRGGKDVAAALGELSDLGRDLTILKAAPEGGAALLSGLYDRKTLLELGRDESMRRFLYLTATLQACCAALPDSFHPRTDAELCLLKLCDETLSGDLLGLTERVARLEQGAPRQPSARPLHVRQEPRREEPPLPDGPAEGERVFDVPDEPVRQPKATAAPKAATALETASAGDAALWDRLINQYKGRLPVNHRVFLNMARGVVQDDVLTVYCSNDFVRGSLDNGDVLSVLQEVTSAAAGRPVRVVLTVGKAPEPPAASAGAQNSASPAREAARQTDPREDRLSELVKNASQLDHFKIK